jgi:phosphohistidine phosphatase
MTSQSRILYLLRHAKSSWSNHRLDDHDRPVSKRGQDALNRLLHYVTEADIAPELVLCSSARRTVMTLEGIASALPADINVSIETGLYGAPSHQLLDRLHGVSDDVASLLLIGHNPGLDALASLLVGGGDEELRQRVAATFPTGALATLAFDGRWSDLAPSDATLHAFVVPRELSR